MPSMRIRFRKRSLAVKAAWKRRKMSVVPVQKIPANLDDINACHDYCIQAQEESLPLSVTLQIESPNDMQSEIPKAVRTYNRKFYQKNNRQKVEIVNFELFDGTNKVMNTEAEESTLHIKQDVSNSVKEEINDIFQNNQNKSILKHESMVTECLKVEIIEKDEYNLSGGIENQIKIEEIMIKQEIIPVDDLSDSSINTNDPYCNECGEDYDGYCPTCLTLTHILNNISLSKSEQKTETIPRDILEIQNTLDGKRVVALKTIPKNVIFGPYEGISPIECKNSCMWESKDMKLANAESGNWMQFISCTKNYFLKNLSIFQFEGNLYFETKREIHKNEELLVYFSYDEIHQSNGDEESYFIPMLEKKSQKIFACTLCCLGFRLEKSLIEHKRKCRHAVHKDGVKEIIQCFCCKIWLEKGEYMAHHVIYCGDNNSRIRNYPALPDRRRINSPIQLQETDENYSKSDPFSYKLINLNEINSENNLDIDTYSDVKAYDSDICRTKFEFQEIATKNDYSDTECSYETNNTINLRKDIDKYKDVVPLRCGICLMAFNRLDFLQSHIENIHREGSEGQFKCTECPYQSPAWGDLQDHFYIHTDNKMYVCHICHLKFKLKHSLTRHINYIHMAQLAKQYKCIKCPFQTIYRRSLQSHHKAKHSNESELDCKCQKCSYQTSSSLSHFRKRLQTHGDVQMYGCDVCGTKYMCKHDLQRHKQKHGKGVRKHYRCKLNCVLLSSKENSLGA